ncbi:MAG: undecaprenyl-diphosphate phosphatase [Candidatus Thermoplasmatota archaeon]|nr:undecaprenyl-diphosphate phosphatase [Candidatus Thermoplasmatota archaeon]MBU4071840.1 undecaprenyl-diphosphate phosphatase [Candidatus Thermoplasmatota archaeon]MBU4144664.1 undecaprenyl-diphosphate phosphatase [Candidatus Thermoplasmatota archaeon]MBU4592517.1 undecaprenyl-diphosphate phosphatase [Candidatus Thermoplasmatota archaeon]
MLDWFTALLVGTIQGLLEWLPISSSGQTTLVMVNFLGIRPEFAISFGLAVHIGTAMAVFARYPRPLVGMLDIRNFTPKKKFYWLTTIISLLCALPIMFLLESTFDSELWTGVTITLLIGLGLVATGIILGRSKKSSFRPISRGRYSDYLLVGIAQAFAVLPGVSRSGMTMATLLGRRFREVEALTFSFLLSVPVSMASFAYIVVFGDMGEIPLFFLGIAAVSSFVFGYLSMGVLVKMASDLKFSKFCILLGGITIAFACCLLII